MREFELLKQELSKIYKYIASETGASIEEIQSVSSLVLSDIITDKQMKDAMSEAMKRTDERNLRTMKVTRQ